MPALTLRNDPPSGAVARPGSGRLGVRPGRPRPFFVPISRMITSCIMREAVGRRGREVLFDGTRLG
jgi:hypothetical protein